MRVDCSSSRQLRSQVTEVNAGLAQWGLGFSGKFETQALQQVREATEQLALDLEASCQSYNACVMSREQYLEDQARIQTRLSQHIALAATEKQGPSAQRGNELWQNALPEQASARLELDYRLLVHTPGGDRTHHPGEVLHSGDLLRFRLSPSQRSHVYVLLLSSQGEASVLFPLPRAGLDNPLAGGGEVLVPPHSAGSFVLDDAPGTEHLQIIASRQPLRDLQARLDALTSATAPAGQLLKPIGELLCSDPPVAERGLHFEASSVACNRTRTRGIQLSDRIVAEPNDDIIVLQHAISHQPRG